MIEKPKIVAGIERLSTLFRATLWEEAKRHGLSPLQTQILLFVASHASALSSVSQLAKEFAITKATASDAVRVLIEKKLLVKRSLGDARAFSLALTASGKRYVQESSVLTNFFDNVLSKIPAQDNAKIWGGLLLLLGHLQKTGIIPLRICFSCEHYSNNNGVAYCHLLQQVLRLEDIRLDCSEHKLAA